MRKILHQNHQILMMMMLMMQAKRRKKKCDIKQRTWNFLNTHQYHVVFNCQLPVPMAHVQTLLVFKKRGSVDDNTKQFPSKLEYKFKYTQIYPMTEEKITPPAPAKAADDKSKKESFGKSLTSEALRPFVIISSSYLLFTITDGAIRMIVLLHAYNKSFSALEVAIMFTLYELAGVFTNLAAGFMGAKWGIRLTLITGLVLQLVSYGLLFGWDDSWDKRSAILYVTMAQMFAGVAKDLTKLGGKTVTKLVTPEEQDTRLFKLVSLITGWKNSLKGVGYFAGSALLNVSYELALGVMMIIVGLALPFAIFGLDNNLGTAKKSNAGSWKEVFAFDNKNLNVLSAARLFLFASRDFWFEVPLPFYLRSPGCVGLGSQECTVDSDCVRGAVCAISELCNNAISGCAGVCENLNPGGGCGGLGLDRTLVGAFLGGYIILYGQVQSWTPQLVTGPLNQTYVEDCIDMISLFLLLLSAQQFEIAEVTLHITFIRYTHSPPNKLTEILWGFINCLPTLVMCIVMGFSPAFEKHDLTPMTVWFIVIISVFAVIFAVNSSIHSYLVVKYAKSDKVAKSVGFYYMSNACGRLFGTIGSGFLYTYVGKNMGSGVGTNGTAGLAMCFLAGTICSIVAASITYFIDDSKEGLKCGPCTLVQPQSPLSAEGDDDEVDVEIAKTVGGETANADITEQKASQS